MPAGTLQHVVLTTTAHVCEVSDSIVDVGPWFDGTAAVDEGIEITRIDHRLAERIMDACQPSGLSHRTRQFGPAYAYVHTALTWTGSRLWGDAGSRLGEVTALGRLLHPTCDGFEYAAALWWDDNADPVIVPGPPVVGPLRHMFVFDGSQRSWLTAAEVECLPGLYRAFRRAKLPDRVRRALWQHEYAASVYWPHIRGAAMVVALEALLSTSRRDVSWQFYKRGALMASEVGVDLSEGDLEFAYDARSATIHGGRPVFDSESKPTRVFDLLQRLVGRLVTRAIRDTQFAAVFDDPEQINQRWPVPSPPWRRGGAAR